MADGPFVACEEKEVIGESERHRFKIYLQSDEGQIDLSGLYDRKGAEIWLSKEERLSIQFH